MLDVSSSRGGIESNQRAPSRFGTNRQSITEVAEHAREIGVPRERAPR